MHDSDLVLLLALLGLVPLLFMGLTAFVKISTVLFITRSAIGLPAVPANLVVLVLAGALTILAMTPVGLSVYERVVPLLDRTEERSLPELGSEAVEALREPLRSFYRANAAPRELDRFAELARKQSRTPAEVTDSDFRVVLPAFLVTELLEAFALGFAIFLPFLVVDLIVANVLVALGVPAMNPAQVALPFKLLLFVAVDGWGLLSQALITGYSLG
jgi:type III secretion protein R